MPGILGSPKRLARLLDGRFAGPALGFIVFLLLSGIRALGWLQPLELAAYDLYVRGRAQLAAPAADSPILIVRVREEDIGRFRHPLEDGTLARALRTILSQAPRAVGVDVYRTFPVGSGRAELEAIARDDPRVAFVFQLSGSGDAGIPAPDFLAGTGRAVLSDLVADSDGVVRRALLYMWDPAGVAHPSLAWWLALTYLASEPSAALPRPGRDADGERRGIGLGAGELWRFEGDDGGYVDADDGDYQVLLDYAYGAPGFASVSFSDLIDGRVDPERIRDRVVILGTTAPSVKDDFLTPLGPPAGGSGITKGVEVHAHAVEQFLRTARAGEHPIRTLAEPAELLWLLAWCLVWGWVGDRVRRPVRALLAGAIGLLLLAGSFPLFLMGWWVPVVPPALAGIGAGGLAAGVALARERRERAVLDRMLAVHVSTAVRDRLWQEREHFLEEGRLRGQRTSLTVLMTDLEGFTSASERLGDPGLVMNWLNEYMETMVPLIEAHGGLVDGYWGDAIKADFGAPVPPEGEAEIDRHAVNAVRCALAMGEAMRLLILAWRERGLPPVRMRVGIFTGPAVTGSQGSTTRQKYTSLGDTVNTAARLESFDKESFAAEEDAAACRILIGETTRIRVGDAFQLEPMGVHAVKGKGEEIAIYRVLGPRPETAG
jgi:adenylate cyclase